MLRLSTFNRHVIAARTISGLIIIWGIVAVIVTALETKRSKSENRSAWIGAGAYSILLEVALFVLPVYLVWNLKMRLSAKATVVAGFAFRLP